MPRVKKGESVNGWVLVDKPRNITSTDVVSITRRMFKAQKNGHAGTLDPFATGLLPVAFGEATKLLPYVVEGKKEYEFIIQWGKETDTLDTEGEVVATSDKFPTEVEILKTLPLFMGKIEQTPPAYSAIKINGQRAYDLARKGEDVKIPPRVVEIFDLELLEMLPNRQSRLRVCCSKGTYIRTLGKDIAQKLETKGYLTELRRTKCGIFDIEHAIGLETMENMVYEEGSKDFLLPIRACLRDIAVIAVSKNDAAKLKKGQALSLKAYKAKKGKAIAVFEEDVAAIVEVRDDKIAPIRVFNS